MAISMEFESKLTSDDARKMLEIIEENFKKLKILREIGWCSFHFTQLIKELKANIYLNQPDLTFRLTVEFMK